MTRITGITLAAFLLIAACTENKTGNKPAIENFEKLFKTSIEYKDYQTAIMAAQMLLARDSSLVLYADTLPSLYASVSNVQACDISVDAVLKRKPTDERLLQMKAFCAEQLGNRDVQLDIYNKLYASTKRAKYLYRITAAQLMAGDTKQGLNNMSELEKLVGNSPDSVEYIIDERNTQYVPIKAAFYNMKAIVAAQSKDAMNAKKYFEAALKEFPDFYVARQNYMQFFGRK